MNESEAGRIPHEVAEPETEWKGYGFNTRQVRAGEAPVGAAVPPIALSAAYTLDSFENGFERFTGADPTQYYSRSANPTNAVAEQRIAALEGGIGAFVVASGQAAVNSTVLTLAAQGERIVSTASIYSGTKYLFDRTLARCGVGVDYVWNPSDEAEWDAAITPETRAIFTETLPNPKNDVTDLAVVARVAKRHGLPLIVDNTIATPYLIRPIEHGADIVIHSGTKFLSGHGAALSGVVVDAGTFDWAGAERHYSQLEDPIAPGAVPYVERFGARAFGIAARQTVMNDTGPALSPFNGFLLQQGMETLSLRMEQHVESARVIANRLDAHPLVESVDYAGLPGHPQHEIAERLYGGRSGSVFSFTVAGGAAGAELVIDSLRVFRRMTNIGDTRSLVLHPATTTHVSLTAAENERLGITGGLIRLSIGIETADDLIADLEQALAAAGRALPGTA
jgi:O-acetylhomoserine (thiol)-lyase